jgi:hypothetical protein
MYYFSRLNLNVVLLKRGKVISMTTHIQEVGEAKVQ